MIFMREVLVTCDLTRYNDVTNALHDAGIKCFTRVNSFGSAGRYHGVPGVRQDAACEYRVSVRRRDVNAALAVVRDM